MQFCPKCGIILMPIKKEDKILLTCNKCGHESRKAIKQVSGIKKDTEKIIKCFEPEIAKKDRSSLNIKKEKGWAGFFLNPAQRYSACEYLFQIFCVFSHLASANREKSFLLDDLLSLGAEFELDEIQNSPFGNSCCGLQQTSGDRIIA